MSNKLRPEMAINLLIVEQSLNDAEFYASTLRNAGIPTHPTRVDNEAQLEEKLEDPNFDMVFFADQSAGIKLNQALALCKKRIPDAPVLVITKEHPSSELIVQAMRQGARDIIYIENKDHLHFAAAREFGDLQVRRSLARLKLKLRETEDRCNLLVESSRDAIAYIHEGMYMHANQAYLERFGYEDMEELEGMPIMDMVAPEDHKVFKEFLRSLNVEHGTGKLNLHCRNADETAFDAQLEFAPASIEGEPCTQIVIHDQSNAKELEEKLKQLSSIDTYTGLPNRNAFMEHLEGLMASAAKERKPHGLLYVLIDNLQEIRSKAGITAGDALLKELAEMLGGAIGGKDLLARFGEHTFTILTPSGKTDEAEALAEKIRAMIEDHLYQSVGQMYQPTCSIGISILTASTKNSQALINQCYNACGKAHDKGGNRVSVYDATSMLTEKGEASSVEIEELIRYALDHDRFKLVYQPLVSLQGDSRENYAVLIRLLDKDNKEIFPEHFLRSDPEQDALTSQVDRWVIEHAVKELAKQRREDRKLVFFINVSAAAIRDEQMLLWIIECMRSNNVKGPWITFQLHEEDVRNHTQAARRLMEGLKKIGALIAVDQFGKLPKYETLLKHLPIDIIKTDKSFVQGLASSQEKQDALNEINQKVHEFEKKTVAVGVEDANSLAVLWTVGVDYIQGYYLQEPSEKIDFDFESF